jgi:hypothetical protein
VTGTVNKQNAIIVDIDGTIADHTDVRGHYEYSKVHLDKPKREIMRLIDSLKYASEGHLQMLFVSGREDRCRDLTIDWLRCNWLEHEKFLRVHGQSYSDNVSNYLFMRETGDRRADNIIKEEIYRKHIEPHYNVLYVFDDRDRVVQMWREIGLTCLQVANGNF